MSPPNPAAEWYDFQLSIVDEYCREWLGEPDTAPYLIEEIKHPEKRSRIYEEFEEYAREVASKYA